MANRFSRAVAGIHRLPKSIQPYLLTKLFCSQVKYAKTSKIKLYAVSNHKVELGVKNVKRVQNHIGGVHAIAAALLAESASGIVFGMNVPDNKLPLLKSMKIEYQRRMQGDLKAIATIDDSGIQAIEQDEKGSFFVEVKIFDETGEQPIVCEMDWAWVTKRTKS
ncbi:DUF4442 domain-containing protein [Thalassotalea sp. PLHSN55]|uniref:DUF4442 domain-containing protein n=1 Tax=Thalassotalea sp. PLHSN55 TaxID=3435888 RepID=UPI003F84862F